VPARPAASPRHRIMIAACLLAVGLAAGCGRTGPPRAIPAGGGGSRRLTVVAAENFWGSIAAQLGGDRVSASSIIVSPSTDPHGYQPTAADARTIAGADVLIVNGLGYDEWASQLLEASPAEGRAVLDVGRTLGLAAGVNPHRWYYPADVRAVARRIVADYERLDPAAARYFAARERRFETVDLARYDRLRAEIRSRYGGVPVGYSESIFEGLGEDLHLDLLTPYSFVKAIAEGTDVTAQDKRTVDAQASARRIAVWVFNSQNVTPDVQRVNRLARERGVPLATVTETLSPASETFEAWQSGELEDLLAALHQATGR
jgi:zinc/manganese transport system substrate-binding protein